MLYQTALVVDDSKLARITLKKKIEAQGLTVKLLESGIEALGKLAEINPDIVFMDHLMPEMDGFETTQKIREQLQWQNLAIVMCTGKEHDGYFEEARAIGADAVLAKPPSDEALQTILKTTFERDSEAVSEDLTGFEENAESLDIPEVDLSFDWPDAFDNVNETDNFVQELEDFADMSDVGELPDVNFDNAFDVSDAKDIDLPEPTNVQGVALSEETVQHMVDDAVEKVNDFWQQQLKQILQSRQTPADNAVSADTLAQAVQQALAQEKVHIIADVVAAVEPQAPVNEQALQQSLQQMTQDALQPVNEAVQQLQEQADTGPSEADVKLWVEQALANQPANSPSDTSEQDQALLQQFEQRVQQLETLLAEQLAANTASAEGLIKEALGYVDKHLADNKPANDADDNTAQIALLVERQQKLAQQVSLPKTLSSVAISLGFCALALSVYMFVA